MRVGVGGGEGLEEGEVGRNRGQVMVVIGKRESEPVLLRRRIHWEERA